MRLYKLNPKVRKLLAYPRGELFEGDPPVALPKAKLWMQSLRVDIFSTVRTNTSPVIITVGDVVTRAMLLDKETLHALKYCFIDGETQRGKKITLPIPDEAIRKKIINPRSSINHEIFEFLKETMFDPFLYIIEVIGEEDLLVLPAVLEARNESFVFYGQPPITDAEPPIPAGMVGIFTDKETQESYRDILERFDNVEIPNKNISLS